MEYIAVSSKEFQAVAAFGAAHLTEKEMCKAFAISKTTLRRWVDGVSAPHIYGRAVTIKCILKMIYKKYARFEKQQ